MWRSLWLEEAHIWMAPLISPLKIENWLMSLEQGNRRRAGSLKREEKVWNNFWEERTSTSFIQSIQGSAAVGIQTTEWRDFPSSSWQPWIIGRKWDSSKLGVIGVIYLLFLSFFFFLNNNTSINECSGNKLFTMKTGSLKNKNMSINHESRAFVA